MTRPNAAVAATQRKPLSPKDTRILVQRLEEEGFSVTKRAPKERVRTSILRELARPGATVRIGVVADLHTSSKYQQLTYARDFYRYADGRGVSCYLNAGDNVDGHPRMHDDAVLTQFRHGYRAQKKYAVEALPKSENGPTYFIDGNHDGSFARRGAAGALFGEDLAKERPDYIYLGYREAFVDVGPARILLRHGALGGLSYARSYKVQKLLEQMDQQERNDVDVAIYGHWHVALELPGYQSVAAYLAPCFQRQTPFLKDLGVQPVIGGFVLEIEFGQKGVWNVRTDWRLYREPLRGDYPGAELDGEAA